MSEGGRISSSAAVLPGEVVAGAVNGVVVIVGTVVVVDVLVDVVLVVVLVVVVVEVVLVGTAVAGAGGAGGGGAVVLATGAGTVVAEALSPSRVQAAADMHSVATTSVRAATLRELITTSGRYRSDAPGG